MGNSCGVPDEMIYAESEPGSSSPNIKSKKHKKGQGKNFEDFEEYGSKINIRK